MEQTLSLIKPDAVERNLIGKIVTVFEENNLTIKEIKKIQQHALQAQKTLVSHRDMINKIKQYGISKI